jgi:hypothetical protein
LGCPRPDDEDVQELAEWYKALEELRLDKRFLVIYMQAD